jgi:cardiolipin synthase
MLTIPNLLTLLRLLLIPCFLMAAMGGDHRLAFILFVSAAVTDILDGAIARKLNQRSRVGAIFDPAADKLMMFSAYLFYTLSSAVTVSIPGWLLFTVFIRDFLITTFAYLLYTRVRVTKFPPSVAGKASTVLQAVTLSATIAANAFGGPFIPLAIVLFKVALVVTLYSSFDYLRRGERLLEEGIANAS